MHLTNREVGRAQLFSSPKESPFLLGGGRAQKQYLCLFTDKGENFGHALLMVASYPQTIKARATYARYSCPVQQRQ